MARRWLNSLPTFGAISGNSADWRTGMFIPKCADAPGTNIDILKTGGHKVSALEIEEALREHPAVAECAVVGLPDPERGECVAAAVVLNDGDALDLPSLRIWAKELLAAYKVPSRLLVLDTLPRNAMGKVMKPAVAALFETAGVDDSTSRGRHGQ